MYEIQDRDDLLDFIDFLKHPQITINNTKVLDSHIEFKLSNDEVIRITNKYKSEIQHLLPKSKYTNDLVFGKNKLENIVNITIDGNNALIYISGKKTPQIIQYKPYVLSPKPGTAQKSKKLKGHQYYKYLTEVDYDYYNEITSNFDPTFWAPRTIDEGFMLLNGHTYYKGMTVDKISVLSFDIEATSLDPNDKNAEVILISNTFRNSSGQITKRMFDIHDFKNANNPEKEMINSWVNFVKEIDPDVMIGHNIFGYDLPYLNTRAGGMNLGRDGSELKFKEKVSKFRKDSQQQYEFHDAIISGREIIDTMFLSIKYDIGRDFPSYGLKNIEKHLELVDDSRIEWNFTKFKTSNYRDWPKGKWDEFKQYCRDDSDSPLKMMDIMLPPFFYMTQSVPKSLQQIINQASGSQLDSIMIRSYLQEGYSQPRTSKKTPFDGAISMGVPGVYKNVKKVDVASLYPSIMLQYGIYDRKKDPKKNMINILDYFRTERLENKRLAEETGKQYYNNMQGSQKILINSLYGFLGANFLLYNFPDGAAEVTRHGREILLKGVEWSTGHTLEKIVKKIVNKGKDTEKKEYEWVVGKTVGNGRGYKLVNVDTDSFSITNGELPTKNEFKLEIDELNSIYPKLIIWEDDGVFEDVLVIKAKNYVLKKHKNWCKPKDLDDNGNVKIKYKGSSLTDQKKEPKLKEFSKEIINILLTDNNAEDIQRTFKEYCITALNDFKVDDWLVKKTITKSVMTQSSEANAKVYNACQKAIKADIINGIQEGDKVWLYRFIDGKKHKKVKGEYMYNSKREATMIDNPQLRFSQQFDGNYDKWHYVKRVYNTLEIFQNVVDMDKIPKYHNKSNRKLLDNSE